MTMFAVYSILQVLGKILAILLIAGFSIWASFGFWYQAPFGTATCSALIGIWIIFCLWVILGEFNSGNWPRRIFFILLAIVFLAWWSTIRPSLERMWAPDVTHTVTGTVDGNMVTLHNVRDFIWTSEGEFVPQWQTDTYNLDTITSVDTFLSYWTGPAIAHTLVSFGFADGRHVVFSAEIRKEHHENYTPIGGFFKKFELAMIAATEEDIILTRTNTRGEDVYRYPIDINPEMAKKLFLEYVTTANELAKTPAFYNTTTSNCTTVVFEMAKLLDPGIPMDYRILLSGYLPGYLYDHELIKTDKSLQETMRQAKINDRAQGPRIGFSERIRQ